MTSDAQEVTRTTARPPSGAEATPARDSGANAVPAGHFSSVGGVLAFLPLSIPLSSQDLEQREANERQLLHSTGYTSEQIKRLADTESLPLRRTGNGRGRRYVLYLADFRRWIERLPLD